MNYLNYKYKIISHSDNTLNLTKFNLHIHLLSIISNYQVKII